MEPKEKAKQLFDAVSKDAFEGLGYYSHKKCSKRLAIICVDEIIKNMEGKKPYYIEKTYWHPLNYWRKVKEEIKNI